jgi:ribosome-associated protein
MNKTEVSALELTNLAIEGLKDKKGLDIVRMDLRKAPGSITDYFVICTGTSDRHVQALAESVQDKIRETIRQKPLSVEGKQVGEWVLIDFVDIIVHVFVRPKREFYALEDLWGDAPTEKFANEV